MCAVCLQILYVLYVSLALRVLVGQPHPLSVLLGATVWEALQHQPFAVQVGTALLDQLLTTPVQPDPSAALQAQLQSVLLEHTASHAPLHRQCVLWASTARPIRHLPLSVSWVQAAQMLQYRSRVR